MRYESDIEKPLPFEASSKVKVTAQQHDIEEIILRYKMYIKMDGKWFKYNYKPLGPVSMKEIEDETKS